ncbi:MAG: hypothetical protein FJ397_11045 [Verrucomicrobia bacterium]|jgi:hypothetical protein|nr:hypothetical protein [Verrucomicrobiota bacterium]
MSDPRVSPARPVSLFTIILLLGVFSAFLLTVRYFYRPAPATAYNAAPEALPKDQEWRATAEARRKALTELRAAEATQATSYAWIDKDKGVVQLPLERAMELTVKQYGAKK